MENFRIQVELLIRQALGPMIRLLIRLQISPNGMSVTGFLVTMVAVGLFVSGMPVAAGLIFLLGKIFVKDFGKKKKSVKLETSFFQIVIV